MTVLSAQTIRDLRIIEPCVERGVFQGRSYGLSACGYDIRLDQDVWLNFTSDAKTDAGRLLPVMTPRFSLASAMEEFHMPDDVVGIVHDKSSWAREGLSVFNTVIEPGWRGFLTLELVYHGTSRLFLPKGTPIAQVIFHKLDHETEIPYSGKYQNQERGPQAARLEK